MKIGKEIAEHYTWGQVCDGWHLFKNDTLSIIQERMPGGTEETLHFHKKAQQFFSFYLDMPFLRLITKSLK